MNIAVKNPPLSQVMCNFLTAEQTPFNGDLIDACLAAAPIEMQLNIRTDVGEPIEGTRRRCDGLVEFYNIRYPKDAATEPKWDNDPTMNYPPEEYAHEVGTTWFAKSGSQRLGFDVDSVWGHKGKRALPDDDLHAIRQALNNVPYAEVRRSTSGRGLHFYLLLKGIQVANHTEHAALARAFLGMLCHDAGLDFAPQIDCLGGNMWIWSRRATRENRGFELLKPADRTLTPDDLPPNWRDHVDVVTHKRTRVRVAGVDEEEFSETAGASKFALEEQHRQILDAYRDTGYYLGFFPDYGCYHGHTKGLEEVHKELGLKGYFKTDSPAKEPGVPNCFFFPRPHGAFFVVRFETTEEDVSWGRTANGKACCYFNRLMDLKTACEAVGGAWMGKDGCTCHTLAAAVRLAKMFGYDLPQLQSDRPVNFKHEDAHTLVAETAQVSGEAVKGWGIGYRKLRISFEVEPIPPVKHDYDSVARHAVTTEKENAGWLMRTEDGNWNFEPKDTVKDRLCQSFGLSRTDATYAMGKVAANPYVLVNDPFQPEFLPDRCWNKFGAQLSLSPTYGGKHPHFDKILKHLGTGLDESVKADPWCQRNAVVNGAHFLRFWCASMICQPKQLLPLLYFYSPQRDNGKSTLHRALGLLFARGYAEGTRILNEQFNKMLAGAVLVYLDEERVEGKAAQKMKLYIEHAHVSIRLMRTDAFMFDNYTHWIACYNFTDGIPVENGDERVIMIDVPLLFDDEKDDWEDVMLPALEAEASDFLGTLWTTELPPSGGRLYLPVLPTQLKEKVMAKDRDTDKPSCDRKELLKRIIEIIQKQKIFVGKSRELSELLGEGSWSSSLNHLRRYLRDIEKDLLQHNIRLDLSKEKRISIEMQQ